MARGSSLELSLMSTEKVSPTELLRPSNPKDSSFILQSNSAERSAIERIRTCSLISRRIHLRHS